MKLFIHDGLPSDITQVCLRLDRSTKWIILASFLLVFAYSADRMDTRQVWCGRLRCHLIKGRLYWGAHICILSDVSWLHVFKLERLGFQVKVRRFQCTHAHMHLVRWNCCDSLLTQVADCIQFCCLLFSVLIEWLISKKSAILFTHSDLLSSVSMIKSLGLCYLIFG